MSITPSYVGIRAEVSEQHMSTEPSYVGIRAEVSEQQ